jgi:hypothetical protein
VYGSVKRTGSGGARCWKAIPACAWGRIGHPRVPMDLASWALFSS